MKTLCQSALSASSAFYLPVHRCENRFKNSIFSALQTAVVGQRRTDLAGGRRADVRVGETEIRRVEKIVSFEAELEAQLFGQREALGQRAVNIEIARRVERATRRIAVGVRRGRDEVINVESLVGRLVVEPPVPDAVGPARRAVVDAVLQKDRKRASGRRRDDAGGLPPAQNEAQRPVVQPAFAFAERGLVDAAENDAMLTSADRAASGFDVGDGLEALTAPPPLAGSRHLIDLPKVYA